jgi:hypothetical protein
MSHQLGKKLVELGRDFHPARFRSVRHEIVDLHSPPHSQLLRLHPGYQRGLSPFVAKRLQLPVFQPVGKFVGPYWQVVGVRAANRKAQAKRER